MFTNACRIVLSEAIVSLIMPTIKYYHISDIDVCCFAVQILLNYQSSFAVLTVMVMKINYETVLYTLQIFVAVVVILSALLAVSDLLTMALPVII